LYKIRLKGKWVSEGGMVGSKTSGAAVLKKLAEFTGKKSGVHCAVEVREKGRIRKSPRGKPRKKLYAHPMRRDLNNQKTPL